MTSQARKPYLTDLTDEQWTILEPLIPASKPGGNSPFHERMRVPRAQLAFRMIGWLRR